MDILSKLSTYKNSERTALKLGGGVLTYRQLCEYSDRLAKYIVDHTSNKEPLIVYGHKSPFMIVCFLACVKSGHAYCPIDTSISEERLKNIIETVSPELVLCCTSVESLDIAKKMELEEIQKICESYTNDILLENYYVKPDDIFYIIFTSGSTGNPKGVKISYRALNHFVHWISQLDGKSDVQREYLNQAPFSFDLSVMDLYLSLYNEGKLILLDKDVQSNYSQLFESLQTNKINTWVSTPSFVDMCLVSEEFNGETLPQLDTFLFCGEVLTKKTAQKLLEKFPNAKVYNTYGPTESTVAVTSIQVTNELIEKYDFLPIGIPKKGTDILIDNDEIVIVGDTVSDGYFKNNQLTQEKFIKVNNIPAYRTGDKGYYSEGLLFYCGRIDNQVKVNGYRIELEDIENNMMKVSGIEKVAVIPEMEEGKVKYLTAYCVYTKDIDSKLKAVANIKGELKQYIPSYMIPKKIIFFRYYSD